jgi:mRNA interferase RelE/StbE
VLRPDLTNDAIRFLKKRDAKQFMQILQALAQLCDDPRPVDSIAMGNGRHFRKDVGEFRIIYRFDQNFLFVTVVGNRNDGAVYQEFERKT